MHARIHQTLTALSLLSQGLHSQVIFPDGSYTTQPSIVNTGSNQWNNPYSQGSQWNNPYSQGSQGYNQFPTGNNPWNSPFFYGNPGSGATTYIQTNVCFCVNRGRCYSAGGNTGPGLIDIRIINTPPGTTPPGSAAIFPVSSGINPIIQSQSFCQLNLELCCLSGGYSCGITYSPYTNAPQVFGNQAPFGSYPWQAIIMTTANIYIGAGVLIDHLHILTVAHKVAAYVTNAVPLKVRLGEWDVSNNNEPIPSQEINVARIIIHPQYSSITLANSIAILRLVSPVALGQVPTITTACLPSAAIANQRCWVAGWGATSFSSGTTTQSIQVHVDVPIVDQTTCQAKLRTTRLGQNFFLDTNSFICAGGEAGKDACTGDGGSPLMCPVAGRWYVTGLVAWGIGCGTSDIPGVYINVRNYVNWIQSVTVS